MRAVYEAAFSAYERLVELGVARELARSVLPVGAYTEFYWTVNARALMNFLSLRNSESAQREIRRYAEACETFLERMPVTYAVFVANDRTAPGGSPPNGRPVRPTRSRAEPSRARCRRAPGARLHRESHETARRLRMTTRSLRVCASHSVIAQPSKWSRS